MSKGNEFVEGRNNSASTSTDAFLHNQNKLIGVIDEFYKFGKAAEFIEVNNDLLEQYLEVALDEESPFDPIQVQTVVSMLGRQNHFLTSIKEIWDFRLQLINSKTVLPCEN